MRPAALLAALLAAACAAPAPAPETEPAAAAAAADTSGAPQTQREVAAGNAAFGVDLYKRLAAEPGNVFVSPISIAGAFGPVAAGAEGETLAAVRGAMRFGSGPGLHPALGGLLRGLEREREGATLSIANALWAMEGFEMKPAFGRIGREDYGAAVETLDFRRSEESAKRINDWVKTETRGRIPSLIEPSSLDEMTRLVITNAVYFLGDWARPFNPSATRPEPFHSPGGARQVPLMYRPGDYRYFETDGFQAVDLPYKDESLSMSVFLPRARNGMAAFEAGLDDARLREWLARLDAESPREVRLRLPRLKVEESYQLVAPLRAMGMGIAFTPNQANFRGIADADLFISQVVHKTFLRIDETGTEAAAATGVEIQATSAPAVPPVEFRADRPFFLVIREKGSGAILFMGRVEAPDPA